MQGAVVTININLVQIHFSCSPAQLHWGIHTYHFWYKLYICYSCPFVAGFSWNRGFFSHYYLEVIGAWKLKDRCVTRRKSSPCYYIPHVRLIFTPFSSLPLCLSLCKPCSVFLRAITPGWCQEFTRKNVVDTELSHTVHRQGRWQKYFSHMPTLPIACQALCVSNSKYVILLSMKSGGSCSVN